MFRKRVAICIVIVAGFLMAGSPAFAQSGESKLVAKKAVPTVEETAVSAADPVAVPAAAPVAAPAAVAEPAPAAPAPSDTKTTPATASSDDAAKKSEAEAATPYDFTDAEPDSYWLPAKASGKVNDHVDFMFYAIMGLSIFCFVALAVAVVYLTWRYRHRPGHVAESSPAHDNILEVTWTVIPSIICVLIFIGGWKGYLNMNTPPAEAINIDVRGQKWSWFFSYQVGQDTLGAVPELHVPVNQPIKLTMRSDDVLHSFYVPAFRIKQDVIPKRYSYLWFEADKPGVYRMYCTEYCGKDHSAMKTKVIVHESGGFERWLNEAYEKSQVDCREVAEAERADCYQSQGERIYKNLGCKQCHSLDGTAGTGPTFQGMWGEARNFTDGTSGKVDENYVRESVLDPMAKVRSGYSPVMPTFKGKLKDKDIDALNNWMKTL